MGKLFASDWLMIPLFGLAVAFLMYLWADKILNFLQTKSLGKREEIIRLLRLMNVEVNQQSLTYLMLGVSFGLGSLFFLLFWPNIIIGSLFGISVTVAGFQLPLLMVKSVYEYRCTKFVDQMVDALTIMANGIKSGTNPGQAMQRVVEIMGPPISQEFQQVITQNQFGQSLEDALLDLGQRIPRPDVQMFVLAINILKETGGNLAETFQTIVSVIRERQKVEKKIQALTAQGIMQGLIVTMVPFVLGIVFYLIDPEFIKPMFSTTLGLFLCFAILVLVVIGGIVIKKVVTIKV